MWTLTKPTADQIAGFLNEQRQLTLTYVPGTVDGFNVDEERVLIGRGEVAFLAACQALRQWRMFPADWTEITATEAALAIDQDVAVLARVCELWWLNACRIISVIDETNPVRRFGFTYATLPGHVEMGEELFLVEWDTDDSVWYRIRAVSRPRYWLVKLAYPVARWMQRRFRRDSMRAMQLAVRDV